MFVKLLPIIEGSREESLPKVIRIDKEDFDLDDILAALEGEENLHWEFLGAFEENEP